ncbi:hypothetical protein F8M41_003457 [Gigaspora margarita]|uniref:Uncharacterized protein n=1 Tax=Gigaspora margarita TaxID=4874 RepID=A0A8H4AYA6_GIGMA|nr:hypothetical protein F8M41_003457 [Gigaspora margarita]
MNFFDYLQSQAAFFQHLVQEFQAKLTHGEIECETNQFKSYSGKASNKKDKNIESWAKNPQKITKMPYNARPKYQKIIRSPIEEEYVIINGFNEYEDKATIIIAYSYKHTKNIKKAIMQK